MIAVCGPVGAGKTSFARAFAELLNFQHVPEYIDMENEGLCRKYDVVSEDDALMKWKSGEWGLHRFQSFILESVDAFLEGMTETVAVVMETPPWIQMQIFVDYELPEMITHEEKMDLRERAYSISMKHNIQWKTQFHYVCRDFDETAQMIETMPGEWDVVYCCTEPEQCLENIRERSRSAESGYTLQQCILDREKYDTLMAVDGIMC
jgi:deoxyadenosine/deoxycytidine kinase